MRKNRLFCLWICLCLLLSYATPVCFAAEQQTSVINDSVANGSHTLDAKRPILGDHQMITNAQAVVLYELNTQTLMHAWNADARMYPSSLVKIMTAMIVIESNRMDEVVTVKKSVLDTVDYYAIKADLKDGEQISVENLLYCMMVGSANDAAAVLADYISGNEAAFVQLMNQKAAELGCRDTNFMNAHGLHDENQYSTARDLAKILEAAMRDPVFCAMFGAASYKVPATNKTQERKLHSSNYLMSTDSYTTYIDTRVTGGRTGRANDGTRCLAVSAYSDGLNYISIMLGSESEYEEDGTTERVHGSFRETKQLLDRGFDNMRPAQILYPNQALTQVPVGPESLMLTAGPNEAVSTILPVDISTDSLRYVYSMKSDLSSGIKKGESVGAVTVMHADICIAYAELLALHELHTAPQPWTGGVDKVSDEKQNLWVIIFLLAVVVVGIVLVFFLIRKRKKNSERYFIRRQRNDSRRNR